MFSLASLGRTYPHGLIQQTRLEASTVQAITPGRHILLSSFATSHQVITVLGEIFANSVWAMLEVGRLQAKHTKHRLSSVRGWMPSGVDLCQSCCVGCIHRVAFWEIGRRQAHSGWSSVFGFGFLGFRLACHADGIYASGGVLRHQPALRSWRHIRFWSSSALSGFGRCDAVRGNTLWLQDHRISIALGASMS